MKRFRFASYSCDDESQIRADLEAIFPLNATHPNQVLMFLKHQKTYSVLISGESISCTAFARQSWYVFWCSDQWHVTFRFSKPLEKIPTMNLSGERHGLYITKNRALSVRKYFDQNIDEHVIKRHTTIQNLMSEGILFAENFDTANLIGLEIRLFDRCL